MKTLTFLSCLLFLLSCQNTVTEFKKDTGLSVSEPIEEVYTKDTYGIWEGEYSIVFKTTPSQIQNWIASSPPWNAEKWQHGAIPYEMGGGRSKFYFSDGVGWAGNKYVSFANNEELLQMLNDTSNYFISKERCCSDNSNLRFHRGNILILQTSKNRVWYSVWDY